MEWKLLFKIVNIVKLWKLYKLFDNRGLGILLGASSGTHLFYCATCLFDFCTLWNTNSA